MNEPFAVELVDVVKKFGPLVAVNHISLQIRDVEFFSLLGPSGCGKTTTLRMIAGFERLTSGQIRIGGVPQGFLPPYKRPVNTVFQHYALFPHMTVFKNVAFGLEMQGVSSKEIHQRVGEALEMVHLRGMEKRRPKQLSGGQQQRVALARALVNHPKVLLLDEPLGALDLKLRKQMQVELKELQHRVGITFVYVTHDQEEALTMSDRIGIMDRGNLLQVGTARQVYETPQTRFVADFIGDTNYFRGILHELTGEVASVRLGGHSIIKANAAPNLKIGQTVGVAVRPEKISINPNSELRTNLLTGCKVRDVVYTGVATTYLLTTKEGEEVMVRYQNVGGSESEAHRPGETVSIGWPEDACQAVVD